MYIDPNRYISDGIPSTVTADMKLKQRDTATGMKLICLRGNNEKV